MKEILLASVKGTLRCLAIVSLMVGSTLFAEGELALIGALFIGYFAAAVFLWTMVYRIWRSAGLGHPGAKREMLWGLALRFLVLFVVLFVAIHISVRVFAVAASGFLLCYFLFLAHLVIANYRSR